MAAAEAFAAADTNGDGTITLDEFKTWYQDAATKAVAEDGDVATAFPALEMAAAESSLVAREESSGALEPAEYEERAIGAGTNSGVVGLIDKLRGSTAEPSAASVPAGSDVESAAEEPPSPTPAPAPSLLAPLAPLLGPASLEMVSDDDFPAGTEEAEPGGRGGLDRLDGLGGSRPFQALGSDLAILRQRYRSDWADGWAARGKVASAVLLLYVACLAPTVSFGGLAATLTGGNIGVVEFLVSHGCSGMLYALLSGQPMTFIAPTGNSFLLRWCERARTPLLRCTFHSDLKHFNHHRRHLCWVRPC